MVTWMGFKTVAPITTMGNRRKPPLVGCFVMGILNREVGEIELIPIAKGITSRWWIVLIAAMFGIVAMWLQESDLATTPAVTEISRIYESRDETALLSVVGIDPASISPLPSFDNQILRIQEQSHRDKIAQEVGTDVVVAISRSEQRFSLLDTVEGDGKTRFTFLSVGTPTYTFRCSDSTADTCNTAIDAYLAALVQTRKTSIVSGMDRLMNMLESAAQAGSSIAQEKLVGLQAASPLITGELTLLSSEEVRSGATISTVKTSTYLFGLIAGALVGLLIALQLTLIDKRVRSLSQLSKRFEARALLGTVTDDETSIQHVAAAIVARAQTLSLASISLVPVDEHTDAKSLAERIHAVASSMGVTVASLANISMLSANELISSHSGMIALASRGVSLTEDIVTTWSVLESAQKPMLGVILTDSTI
jgi:capsular polysaccharide biosynthesis protein